MEKWTRQLTEKIDRIHNRVQALLDGAEVPVADPEAPPFEPSHDARLTEGLSIGLPDDHVDRAIVVFNRLSGLFEAGVLLQNHDTRWIPQAVFREGQARAVNRGSATVLSLPEISPLQALRTASAPLLGRLNLKDLDPGGRRQAILVKPAPDFAYVLLSGLPDLWLKDHLERVLAALARGFSE